jgi:hypothetical protein
MVIAWGLLLPLLWGRTTATAAPLLFSTFFDEGDYGAKGKSAGRGYTHPLVDPYATQETVKLFYNLQKTSQWGILLGQTDANIMGINANGSGWFYQEGRSDIKDVVGDYPAIYGFDIVNLENRDIHSADDLKYIVPRIQEAYARGGIITLCWHAYNPLTLENYFSGKAVSELLPGKKKHHVFTAMLDKLAHFIGNLKDARGRSIPIIFRPWHEANGGQFWWGKGRCSDDEYKRFYRFTVEYLRDVKGVHNFLYAYSPVDWYQDMGEYFERYPGDDYVDVLGLDTYGNGESWYKERLLFYARELVKQAESKNKIAAFSEMGFKASEKKCGLAYCTHDYWFTDIILGALKNDATARRLAYMVFWRNEAYNPRTYYLPYPGSVLEADFIHFYHEPLTLFGSDLPRMYD